MGRVKESIAWPNATDYTVEINQRFKERFNKIQPKRAYGPPVNKYMVVGDRVEEVKTVTVYEFSIGDVDDPDLYAAQPLIEWENSDKGQWIMNNAIETPSWHRISEPSTFGYRYCIRAKFMGAALTEYLLRYGK